MFGPEPVTNKYLLSGWMKVTHYQGCMCQCWPAGHSSVMGQLGAVQKRWGRGRMRLADPEGPFWDSESLLSLPEVQRTLTGLLLLALQSETCTSRSGTIIELDKSLTRDLAVPNNSSQRTRPRLNRQRMRTFIKVIEHNEPRATERCLTRY